MATLARTTTELRFEAIKPKIGARVLNTKDELLSGDLTDSINDLLEQRGVLVFKQLHFTDEEQIRFTNLLGGNATEIGVDGGAIFSISLDEKEHKKE
ncbi:MAG TPA: TauD/TfdA family dioxygenase, partial [Novosphingobium sp.]|nr:TauD/TfdA family dioxygenase [Novosphingobium sp.]